MGVPGFFLWLWKTYKARHFVFSKSNIPKIDEIIITNIDYFLLDMNCMIHPVCFETLAEFNKTKDYIDINKLENKMIENVIIYLEKLISIAEPKKGIYIAIDGVAPVAKMKQQRMRRYKSIHDNELFNKIKTKHNIPIPYFWNNSAITPGTKFMKKLTQHLTEWSTMYNTKHKLEIIFSPSSVPGEGEHKVLQFIRSNKTIYNYIVYGLDADLIFLMLSTGLDTIYLMREANKMDSNTTDIINFISLKTMKTCIVDSFSNIIEKKIDKSVRFKISNEKIIDDFIFICSLMGNDFLPHMPALDIYDHAIDRLMETYVDILITNNYIIDRTSPDLINNDIFYKFIVKLASMEEETIVVNYGKKKRIPYCMSKEPYEIEIFRIENMIFKYNDPIRLGDGTMSEWRERYYKHHYMVEKGEYDEFANNMAYHYMIGLKWVTMYYFDKCPSWDWYYPFDHAPFLNDMVHKMKDNIFMIEFKESVPLSPLMQLLIVLPKDTCYLLPDILRKIMTNTNSSAAHLYPSKFELDMIGKKKYWMCNPILPNLEINLIKKIFEKYYPMLLSDIKEYDKMGENLIFKFIDK